MDYEKKYNEALERAKEFHHPQSTTVRGIVEEIFPELRESEDERIRKELIELLKEVEEDETYTGRQHIPDMLAYLEKQKDASKAIEAVDRIDKYIDEHLANAHDMKDSNPDKKYYRGWDDALGKMAGILQDVYSNEKRKEQKPNYCHHEVDETGWTEEYRKAYYDGWNNCNMQHEQLKADHKPAEWSEEDEKMLSLAIEWSETMSGQFSFVDMDSTDFRKIINWLQSLRPQPHWKPSEEQMMALHDAKNYLIAYCQPNIAKVLSELEEQLQKL